MNSSQKMIRRTPESDMPTGQHPRAPRIIRQGVLIIEVSGSENFPQPLSVQFHDGSVSGIGFISSKPLIPSTRFAVVVSHATRGNLVLNYEVVRCKQKKGMIFEIGAKLVR